VKAIAVSGAIILNAEREILLAQRPPGKHLAGSWEFPGGKIEDGESASEALIRELREELELEVEILESLGVFPHRYETHAINLHIFVVKALSLPRATASVHVFKWSKVDEVQTETLAPADRIPFYKFLSTQDLRPGQS
jgi:8-oxo-dGTP diphosphatase